MNKEKVSFKASDGFELKGLWIEAEGELRGSVMFSSATGVKKEYYLNFAEFLAKNGFSTLLFDYRGIGESGSERIKEMKTHMHEYGTLDQNAAMDFLEQTKKAEQFYFLGHSIGAQLMGVLERPERIIKVLAINTSVGYWRNFPFPWNLKSYFLWKILGPILTWRYKYFRGDVAGLGESLPTGVFREWRKWCLSKDHFMQYLIETTGSPVFDKFDRPVVFMHASDDYISTSPNVQRLREFYPNSEAKIHKIDAASMGGKIGHIPIFRSRFEANIWPLFLAELTKAG